MGYVVKKEGPRTDRPDKDQEMDRNRCWDSGKRSASHPLRKEPPARRPCLIPAQPPLLRPRERHGLPTAGRYPTPCDCARDTSVLLTCCVVPSAPVVSSCLHSVKDVPKACVPESRAGRRPQGEFPGGRRVSVLPRPWEVQPGRLCSREFQPALGNPPAPMGVIQNVQETREKPQVHGGRAVGAEGFLRLSLKHKGRVEAAGTGISLRRPQN